MRVSIKWLHAYIWCLPLHKGNKMNAIDPELNSRKFYVFCVWNCERKVVSPLMPLRTLHLCPQSPIYKAFSYSPSICPNPKEHTELVPLSVFKRWGIEAREGEHFVNVTRLLVKVNPDPNSSCFHSKGVSGSISGWETKISHARQRGSVKK